MTVQTFLMLLTVFSTVTSFVTEALKKLLDSVGIKYASNIVVLIGAALTGGIGTPVFYIISGTDWNFANITCIFIMIIANWLGATLGYDKVTQAIQQFKKK